MFNLEDMIILQMRKNGLENRAELLKRMNELNDGTKYDRQHLYDIFVGNNVQVRYLYAMEKVFGLPENALVRMVDLSCVPKKNIINGGKMNEIR